MKEFMALIRKQGDNLATLSPEEMLRFLNKLMDYIGKLEKDGNLIAAQPLERKGTIISGRKGALKDGPFVETKEVIAGYYHLLVKDLEEAVALVKENPEFEYGSNVTIEIRPVKTVEESVGFVFPGKLNVE